jgi:hypothetical protein
LLTVLQKLDGIFVKSMMFQACGDALSLSSAKATQIFFHYYQMWDTTSYSLVSIRGFDTSRYHRSWMVTTRFGAQ